ncbi:hypothetical protein C7B77_05010 [Chamaesiphon polymorphus CCALA 037]|uniref:Uncharacterized protein n=1 Tax=Chamaesiphon polymorphus CCALA 037 TaxID=2107692 RepID=A0A2T1GKI8_9CYAN|nr:hypothetical protein C7B77_05010 [Chamaesiphon polymorphus CCALA 037]
MVVKTVGIVLSCRLLVLENPDLGGGCLDRNTCGGNLPALGKLREKKNKQHLASYEQRKI